MDLSTSIRTFSLALSLLRHSSPPSQSFVLSPFSLNTALSIVHDGANGPTQEEFTNLLLAGSSPTQVTDFYSSLSLSLPSNSSSGVSFTSANRFYVDHRISLRTEYQKHVEERYGVQVQNLDLSNSKVAAGVINNFIDNATNGKINDVINSNDLDGLLGVLINAIYFRGNWEHPFTRRSTHLGSFFADSGKREMNFMEQTEYFQVNLDNEIGTVLIMPYRDRKYSFFYLMPNISSSLETMRETLTGDILANLLNGAHMSKCQIRVPKFKIESELEGIEVLKKMGVSRVFNSVEADLSKISDTFLYIDKIQHNAMIEMDETGTEAAAATVVGLRGLRGERGKPLSISINRPFLFGIHREDQIIFIGQFA